MFRIEEDYKELIRFLKTMDKEFIENLLNSIDKDLVRNKEDFYDTKNEIKNSCSISDEECFLREVSILCKDIKINKKCSDFLMELTSILSVCSIGEEK